MSVSAVCPSCGEVTSHYAPPARACPQCGSEYPEALRRKVDTALRRESVSIPFLINLARIGAPFVAAVGALFLILAPLNIGTYSINQEIVSGPEFVRRAGLWLLLMAALSAGVGIGLWRGRAWARSAILAFWIVMCLEIVVLAIASPPGDSNLGGIALSNAIILGCVGWYLFGKANVKRYFESLPGWDFFRDDDVPGQPNVNA